MVTRQQIGVIGGGQLAWMLAIAAKHLGLSLAVQAASADDSAVSVADRVIYGKVADAQATAQLAEYSQVITFENEFVDLAALQELAHRTGDRGVLFLPKLETLAISVDKLNQRQHFQSRGIPTPKFYSVDSESALLDAATKLGYPFVLKARRHGYDGKGTWIIGNETELKAAWDSMHKAPAIAEAFIPFERELAVIAARSESGEISIYPVVETLQANQVCRRTIAPARIDQGTSRKVEAIATEIVSSLDAIGVFGIEFFLTSAGEISVNEIAPRTHNSGHYTIEGCQTSQFEQLLRVVSGQPLGNVSMLAPVVVMVNLLGFEKATWSTIENSISNSRYANKLKEIASFPNTHIHWYNKTSSSVGRKLGHVTILAETHTDAINISNHIEGIWYGN